MDYWKECISEAFEDAGITATDQQIEIVAEWVEGAHENYGMAMGHDCIPNPLTEENRQLQAEVKKEREKVFCEECQGRGRISQGPYHSGGIECSTCRGEGRHTR